MDAPGQLPGPAPSPANDQRTSACGWTSLLAFLATTYIWSWTCWLLAPWLTPWSAPVATVVAVLGGFGPGLAAVAVTAWAGGRRALSAWWGRCLNWRIGGRPFVWAIVLPAAVLAPAALVPAVLDGGAGPSPLFTQPALAAANLVLILLFGGPLGEEFGWRGFAWPVLRARHGWRASSLLLGALWGVWHLPLFFVQGTAQSRLPFLAFLPFVASAMALSVVFGWLSRRSQGSVLPALALHTAVNWGAWVTPGLLAGTDRRPMALALGMLALLSAALLAWPGAPRAAVSVSAPAAGAARSRFDA